MSNKQQKPDEAEQPPEDNSTLKPVAIEGNLPLKAVGIENLREANPKHMPPHVYLHPWFARRPTPASRLAVLASTLPKGTDTNQLLDWMQFGPKEDVDIDISDYVEEKKSTESQRSGTLGEHYGYPRPHTLTPSQSQRDELHDVLKDFWGGDLPTVLDATAGGGVIPYESLRYGYPTKANELNPVPSLLLKVILEYAPATDSLGDALTTWGERINQQAKSNLSTYFPEREDGAIPDSYATTYNVNCPSCGCDIPLVPKWWVRTRKSADTVVARPTYTNGDVSYEALINPTDEELDRFDPDDGPLSRGGDVECPSCGVVTESSDVKTRLQEGEFTYDPYCVRLKTDSGYEYRSPNESDYEALREADNRVNDFDLLTLLSTRLPPGQKTNEPREYGMEEWRDLFSPRQLVSHYEFLQAFQEHKPKIREEHDEEAAEAILTILALVESKMVNYNSRLAPWDTTKGYPGDMFRGKNFSFKRAFVDNNVSIGSRGYLSHLSRIKDSYEKLASQLPENTDAAEVTTGDAAHLSQDDDSVEAVVIDPPYYSSIMYAELSDVFYVWLREYLSDVHPGLFEGELTEKDEEAVANPSRFDGLSNNGTSKKQLAKQHYEDKMSEIFSELYRVLKPGGVMTVMFTHKETDAWDTLTMSLINAGFVVTSTHPITSEMPQRSDTRGGGSADSTILLSGRKPLSDRDPTSETPSLWEDVEKETRETARESAKDLLDSGLSLTKTDVIISAFGPTLQVYADNYPVVDRQDNEVPPREALTAARDAVTRVLSERYIQTEKFDDVDELTKWYIISWLVHNDGTIPYDEGLQLGHGLGIDIDEIKRSTKIWGKSSGDIELKDHNGRVQDITKLESGESVSSRKYPVNPTAQSFDYKIDAVHAALHVYEKQGTDYAWSWLSDRGLHNDARFRSSLIALLKVLPESHDSAQAGRGLISGDTGKLLNISPSEVTLNVDVDEDSESGDQKLDSFGV